MPAGRPSKYRVEFCDRIRASGKKGESLVMFAASIGVAKQSLHDWAAAHPEFSAAIAEAKALSEAYWERQCHKIAKSGGNGGMAKFYMGARFGWREVQEIHSDLTTKGESLNVPVVLRGAET